MSEIANIKAEAKPVDKTLNTNVQSSAMLGSSQQ